jgi:hypothetical protein
MTYKRAHRSGLEDSDTEPMGRASRAQIRDTGSSARSLRARSTATGSFGEQGISTLRAERSRDRFT